MKAVWILAVVAVCVIGALVRTASGPPSEWVVEGPQVEAEVAPVEAAQGAADATTQEDEQSGKTWLEETWDAYQVPIVVVVLLVALAAIWIIPARQVRGIRGVPNTKERLQLANDLRKTVVQIIGGIVVIGGLVLTWLELKQARDATQASMEAARQNTQVIQEGQITSRYVQAVEQLGHKEQAVRIGGIYALARIAEDSDRDFKTIMEVLTAYIREKAAGDSLRVDSFSAEIRAAIGVFGREAIRDTLASNSIHLDLKGIVVEGLDLNKSNLKRADLRFAHLRGVKLERANLSVANLSAAHLEGAHLYRANLTEALLLRATLSKADLNEAHLEGAHLHRVNLEEADLTGAHLAGARLDSAHLRGVKLERANLRGAHLFAADLQKADLQKATLTQATLIKATLIKANLSEADLGNDAL